MADRPIVGLPVLPADSQARAEALARIADAIVAQLGASAALALASTIDEVIEDAGGDG